MKTLTKAEEQVMQHIWNLQKAYLKDLIDCFKDPKPAYTTVSSMVRILIEKGFIGYTQHGNNREYYPLVNQNEYVKGQFFGVLKNYFQGSFSKFASFYADSENLSIEDLEEINHRIQKEIENRKARNNE
jgi:BlaI family penicillinase repressor